MARSKRRPITAAHSSPKSLSDIMNRQSCGPGRPPKNLSRSTASRRGSDLALKLLVFFCMAGFLRCGRLRTAPMLKCCRARFLHGERGDGDDDAADPFRPAAEATGARRQIAARHSAAPRTLDHPLGPGVAG